MVCGVLFVYLLFAVFSCVFDCALAGGCLFMLGFGCVVVLFAFVV